MKNNLSIYNKKRNFNKTKEPKGKIEKRKNKIFIDWVRNTKGATSIAPYSLRARINAPVSFPISWDELDKIKPNEITIKKALKRLKQKAPWKKFLN